MPPPAVQPLACSTCGVPLAVTAGPAGHVAWDHPEPPVDGHDVGIPPLVLTLSRDGSWWEAACPGVAGFPARGCTSLEEARTVAWVLLGRVRPPQPVAEVIEGADLGELAKGWPVKGGTLATATPQAVANDDPPGNQRRPTV